MSKQTRHTLVGALALIVAVVVFVVSHRGGPAKPTNGYPVVARFAAIDGVGVGTKVLLTGIQIGQISDYSYDMEGQRAVVKLTIKNGIKIPLDSVVLIVSDGLLGPKYLKIQPGGDIDNMQSGDEFEYVQDSIVFEEILEKVILNAEQNRKKKEKENETKKRPNQASTDGAVKALKPSPISFESVRKQ